MKAYVIDTNIVFTTALNTESRIGQFIMQTDPLAIKFYAPTYLKREIERHLPRIVKLSRQSEAEVREIIDLAYTKITFIDDEQIPLSQYSIAANLIRDVDIDDVHFVALASYLGAALWTGDRKLYRHLIRKGYDSVITFEEVRDQLSE